MKITVRYSKLKKEKLGLGINRAKSMLKPKIYLLFCLLFPLISNGQKWVADSITVSFGKEDTIASSINVIVANDLRMENPSQISVYEQKKALFFPVDQIVKTQTPLSTEFIHKFSTNVTGKPNFGVAIHQFYITNATTGSKRNLTLYSTIELSKYSGSEPTFFGSFYYEQSYIQKKKLPIQHGYETLLEEWSRNFTSDVLSVDQGIDDVIGDQLYHFRRGKQAVDKNFYTGVDFFGGLNFWGVDGEIWFSEPEGSRTFNRSIGLMRFVNHPDFQAIAFGNNVRLWNYRFSDKWLFTHKMAFLFGMNKWKDMATVAHKLEEIPYFNISLSQKMNYNTIDQPGFVFGLGIMEDLHYIIYHNPQLKVGLSFNCAYKF